MNNTDIVRELYNSDTKFNKRLTQSRTTEYNNVRNILKSKTHFLPEDVSYFQRLWHVLSDNYTVPVCKKCGNCTNFCPKAKEYRTFCSIACSSTSEQKRERTLATFRERFGEDHPMHVESIKNKVINTATHDGVHFFATREFKDKRILTSIEKYGSEHHLQNPNILNKQIETNIKKYGTSSPAQNNEVKAKMTGTMFDRYGVQYHHQLQVSTDSLQRLNDRDWLLSKHHDEKLTAKEISKELNVDASTVSDYFRKHDIDVKYYAKSINENAICDFLSTLGVNFIRNSRSVISPKELDIYIPDYNIAIEYNGLYWHSDVGPFGKYHSYEKLQKCNDMNIRLITIYENEWNDKSDIIKEKLKSIMGLSTAKRVFARKTKIVDVSKADKKEFFNTNHIQGDGPSTVQYGLTYDGMLMACIGILISEGKVIINRYATSCNVIGGFSKLLKYVEEKYPNTDIVTFADRRWSEGKLYTDSGFDIDLILKPDYMWSKNNKVWHKFNFRHKLMKTKLKHYNKDKSESENMRNHNYYKIWDCGKIRFIKRNGI